MTYYREDCSTQQGGSNLWDTDGTVEQAQISTHVTIALEGVGNEGERHGKHSSPGTANHQERNKLQILVMDIRNHAETNGANDQTDGIGHLSILKLW